MGQVDLHPLVGQHQRHGFLQHLEHAQAQKIHLDDTHLGAVVLVPLNHGAAGHAGRLQRHHLVQTPSSNDHAAAVLAQMPGQVLQGLHQLEKLPHPLVAGQKAHLGAGLFQGLAMAPTQSGHPGQTLRVQAHDLAHLTQGRAFAIGDDVGGHGGPVPTIAAVNVLNNLLAFRPRGQIQIDVGPRTPLFAQKTFKKQTHTHRVHGRDAQDIADGAVGGRAPSLGQDALLAAIPGDVPDHQKIARQGKLSDEGQLAGQLGFVARLQGSIAPAGTGLHQLVQVARNRLARGHREVGKTIAQILQAENTALGHPRSVVDGLGQIGKEFAHLGRRLQVALAVGLQASPRVIDAAVRPQTRKHVQHASVDGACVAHVVAGHQAQTQSTGHSHASSIARPIDTLEVSMQFHPQVFSTKSPMQKIKPLSSLIEVGCALNAITAQAKQARRVLGKLAQAHRA